MSKFTGINSETAIPLGWALAGMCTIICVVVAGAFWMAAVDFRLSRIEEKLGIPKYEGASIGAIHEAIASDSR